MKRAPLLLLGGTVAGLAGIFGFLDRPAPLITPSLQAALDELHVR